MKKLISTFLLTACLSVHAFGAPVVAPTTSPGGQVMRVEAENLYDYEVVKPTADVEQFYDFEAQFPNIKELNWNVESSQRSEYFQIFIDGKLYTHDYMFIYASDNRIGADLGGTVVSKDVECKVVLPAGAFTVKDIDGNEVGTNPDLEIIINKGKAADELNFECTYESPTAKFDNMTTSLAEVNVVFTALDKVSVNAADIVLTLGDTTLDTQATVNCTENTMSLAFSPAIESADADKVLKITMPAGTLTGTKGDITNTNTEAVELTYTIVPTVVRDLRLELYSPAPNADGEISATKSFAMTMFVCDEPGLKALTGLTNINATIHEVNGEYKDEGHLKIITGMVSGKSTFYVEFNNQPVYNGEYIITIEEGAFGDERWLRDHTMGRSNPTFTIPFKLVDGEERQQTPALNLSIAQVTTKIVGIKGQPTDDTIYWYANVTNKENYPGPTIWEDIVENFFKAGAELFNMDWIEIYRMTAKTGEYTWWYSDLEPSTDYVAYGFALDENGELCVPVEAIEFRTPDAIVSDNTFTLDVLSIEPGTDGINKNVTVKVTTTNDDPYAIVYTDKYRADYYKDMTPGSESEKLYLREVLEPLVNENNTYTGEQTVTFENVKVNAILNIAVFGYQYDPTTSVVQKEISTVDNDLVAVNISVYDPTVTDASATIYSFDLQRPFIWGVISKESAESIGGIQNVHEEVMIPSWEAAGFGYYPWQQMAVQDLNYNSIDGKITANAGRSALRWDTDYYVYGYTMDEGGYRTSPVFYEEFTTKSRNTGNLEFTLNVKEIVSNAPYSPNTFTANMDIMPSDDESEYALYYGDAYEFETYRDEGRIDDYLYSVFMSKKQKRLYKGYLDFGYGSVYPDKKYILMTTGFDEAPNTAPSWVLFTSEGICDQSSGVQSIASDKLHIYGADGKITIDGDFLYAKVFTTEGRQVGVFNGNVCYVSMPGFYIVQVRTAKGLESHKIIIR